LRTLRRAATDKLRAWAARRHGRDTLPTGGVGYLEELNQHFKEYGVGQLASVSGRYFAMDRDLRWEKERQAFDAMVTGTTPKGTFVRVLQPHMEGLLTQGAQGLNVGDKLRAKLVRTDVQHGFIDFVKA